MRGADSVMPANANEGRDVLVKLRNTAPASRARLFLKGSDEICLQLEKPEYGIATGQAGVIYDDRDDSHMLGGGWICKAPTKADSSILSSGSKRPHFRLDPNPPFGFMKAH